MIDYEAINKDPRFSELSSEHTFDNAQGNASVTCNKTSMYLFDKKGRCIARLCNISLSNIDGNGDMTKVPDNIDDFSVGLRVVVNMVSMYMGDGVTVRMNEDAYDQLLYAWYSMKLVKEPTRFMDFNGVHIVIDNSISGRQTTVN